MYSHKKMAGILLAGSLVSGVGIRGAGAASAGGQTTAAVSQSRVVSNGQQEASGVGQGVHGLSHHRQQPADGVKFAADETANRQFLPAWGVRLAVKAALQVLKKRSVGMYNQIIGAARAGKSAFLNWYAKAPGWVKSILPEAAASALFEAVKWAVGL